MNHIDEAKQILRDLGMPLRQCNEVSGLTLLALANIKQQDDWRKAKAIRLRIHDILLFVEKQYKKRYAENTRETIRRQVIHQFEQAGIVERNPDAPDLAVNSPRTHYALTEEVCLLIQFFGRKTWEQKVKKFANKRTSLFEVYRKRRQARLIPVRVNSKRKVKLSPGKHNQVQADIIDKFAPMFAPGAQLLYLGDTANKMLYVDKKQLKKLRMQVDRHDKLPDILLYHFETNRLFLVEAVTSHGPVSPKRYFELEEMFEHVKVTRVYVSAFPNLKEFKRHIGEIAWETEVWIAEIPDHLIHFNGDKFLP